MRNGCVRGTGALSVAIAALAAWGTLGCDSSGTSVVSQNISAVNSNDGPQFGGELPDPTLEPIGEVTQTAAEAFLERHCAVEGACTACERGADCAGVIRSLQGCGTATCEHGVCVVAPKTDCSPRPPSDAVLCGVGGPAGARVACDISVLRGSPSALKPSSLAFDLVYPETVLQFEGFERVGTEDFAPPAPVTPRGHVAALRPPTVDQWDGNGRILISPDPHSPRPITDAYVDDRAIIGQPIILRAVFTLLHPTLTAVWVEADEPQFADKYGAPLTTRLESGRFVAMSEPRSCVGDQCEGSAILNTPWVALCDLTGQANDVRDCLVQIATPNELAHPATSLEATLVYDAEAIQVENMYAQRCFGADGCFDLPLAGEDSFATSTGHQFVFSPASPNDWNGSISFAALNPAHPEQPLSRSAIDAQGDLTADPLVAWVRVLLLRDAPTYHPARIGLVTEGEAAPMAVTATLEPVPVHVQHGLIVTGAERETK